MDKGTDGVWGAYEFSEEIYLPVIEQHISSVYSEGSLKLQIDGEEVSMFTGEEAERDSYFIAAFSYKGEGNWQIEEYRYLFEE